MKIVVLGSGSKGNSVYIETKEAKVLIDAGLTYAETYNRLRFKNIKLEKLDAVFITHEHTDHINGIVNIAKYTNASLYFNKQSFENLKPTYLNAIVNSKIYFIKANVKENITVATFIVRLAQIKYTASAIKYRQENKTPQHHSLRGQHRRGHAPSGRL